MIASQYHAASLTALETVRLLHISLNKLTETSLVFATIATHQELHIPINMMHFFSLCTSLNKSYKTLSHVLYFTQYKQGYFQFLVTLRDMSEGIFFILNYSHK